MADSNTRYRLPPQGFTVKSGQFYQALLLADQNEPVACYSDGQLIKNSDEALKVNRAIYAILDNHNEEIAHSSLVRDPSRSPNYLPALALYQRLEPNNLEAVLASGTDWMDEVDVDADPDADLLAAPGAAPKKSGPGL